MKKLLFITLILLFFISCFAKNDKEITTTSQVPVKFREKQQYGLFNPVTKEVIAQPKYTYIEKYSDGFCLGVIGEEGGLCDVIDSNGNIIFSYETEPLSKTYCFNGIFSFIYDDGIQYYHGLYDSKGKIFFKCDFIYNMNEECIVTKKNKDYIFLFYDENGF
ncbi:MAG: WG repeat-containing protein, partial [Treponema sp.]|nr:WG repeat-containing protein [Treponema sp.]